MNKKSFLVLLKEYNESPAPELGNIILISFNKMKKTDQLDILLEHNSCDLEAIIEKAEDSTNIKDVIKEANDLEMIRIKSFLVKSVIFTILTVIIIFVVLIGYYMQKDHDSGIFEWIDTLFKMTKLILLDKTN